MPRLTQAVHVWSEDPALDRSDPQRLAEGLARYRETEELGDLPLKPDRRPVLWRLRGLSMDAWEDTSGERNVARMCRLAVQRGLVAVEGAISAITDDGRPLTLRSDAAGPGGRERSLTYECAQDIHAISGALVIELGARILELATPRPPSGQG